MEETQASVTYAAKKRTIIVSSVCAIVVISVLVSLFVWKSTFNEEWIIGKTQNEIEQRFGNSDFSKDDYIKKLKII